MRPPPPPPDAGSSPGTNSSSASPRVKIVKTARHSSAPLAQPQPLVAGPPREDVHGGTSGRAARSPSSASASGIDCGRLPVQGTPDASTRASAASMSSVSVPPWNSNARSMDRAASRAAAATSGNGMPAASPAQIRMRGAPSSRALASTGAKSPDAAPVGAVGRDPSPAPSVASRALRAAATSPGGT